MHVIFSVDEKHVLQIRYPVRRMDGFLYALLISLDNPQIPFVVKHIHPKQLVEALSIISFT